ncbi:carbohydrate ABC transporter substrate-binding protein, CUT1 family [Alkalibacterium putridalgicola]|uniref:Carbohydrate ABC transporter substrate-binding protein, CUT1 family n=1 Tax=Alkalibacterium putridalgicola TaxID=426703 RepID=A0A1H7R903_9LACT|nr:extracellular solute-binding protein [Alkalibacterium putridalgicola]GEK88850.1 sugar ABC transporter substrate-binding protein [Alkalibacterium putridalgicola]SEL56736.1 carbohydrate ABC transporter substrate-binding protein, CUT1 family [Alkalibacterium putridalgicola]
MGSSLKKKLLTGLTLTTATLLMACGGDTEDTSSDNGGEEVSEEEIGSTNAMEDFQVGDTFKAEEPTSFSFLYRDHPNYPIDPDWTFFNMLEEKTNVTLENTVVPLSDFAERRSVLIAAGDAPDILANAYPGEETQFVGSGALLPISEYVHLMPHLSQRIEEWDLEDELNQNIQADGNYYILPGIEENVRHDYTLMINKTVFEEHGLEEPNTWEELEEALIVLRDETGTVPFNDQWTGQALLNFASHSFGTVAGWGFGGGVIFDEEADEFKYAPMEQGYKDMVEYFAGLVDQDLMDPESFTQEDETAQNSFNNLESFVISANSQTVISQRESMDELHGEGAYEIGKIVSPEGPAGPYVGGSRFVAGFMLRNDVKDRDDFLSLLQFVDWLYYSEEGNELAWWGEEGETFEKTDEAPGGYMPLDPITYLGMNPDGTEHLQEDHGFRNGIIASGGTTELLQSVMDEEEIAFQNATNEAREVVTPNPAYPMEAMDQEQLSLIGTPLQDTTETYTLRFITGQYEMDRWDEFMSDLENQNVDQYLDMINEAYQEAQASME